MNSIKFILVFAVMFMIGCGEASKTKNDLIGAFKIFNPLDGTGFEYRLLSLSGGSNGELASFKFSGEIVANDSREFSDGFELIVRSNLEKFLRERGAVLTGEGSGGGIAYQPASGLTGVNIMTFSVRYVDGGLPGSVVVYLVEREYFFDGNVVAQLLFSVNQVN